MKREQLRNALVVLALLVLTAVAFSAFSGWQQTGTLRAETSALRRQVDWERSESRAKDQDLALVTKVLNAVADRIDNMQREQFRLSTEVLAGDLGSRRLLNEQTLLGRLDAMRRQAEVNEQQINSMDRFLNEGDGYLADLQNMARRYKEQNLQLSRSADSLRQKIGSLQREVRQLKGAVAELETEAVAQGEVIASQQAEIASQAETIVAAEEELLAEELRKRTVYIAIGTRRELAQAGILKEKRRGFLRLGKERSIDTSDELLARHFQSLDRTRLREISLGGSWRKVQLHPPRPPQAFVAEPKEGRIKILDPELFWQTKYLVLAVQGRQGS